MTVEGGLEEPEALQPEQGSLALLLPGDEHAPGGLGQGRRRRAAQGPADDRRRPRRGGLGTALPDDPRRHRRPAARHPRPAARPGHRGPPDARRRLGRPGPPRRRTTPRRSTPRPSPTSTAAPPRCGCGPATPTWPPSSTGCCSTSLRSSSTRPTTRSPPPRPSSRVLGDTRPAPGTNLGVPGTAPDDVLLAVAEQARAAGVLAVVVDATALHERGASDAQELAWSMVTGARVLRVLEAAGVAACPTPRRSRVPVRRHRRAVPDHRQAPGRPAALEPGARPQRRRPGDPAPARRHQPADDEQVRPLGQHAAHHGRRLRGRRRRRRRGDRAALRQPAGAPGRVRPPDRPQHLRRPRRGGTPGPGRPTRRAGPSPSRSSPTTSAWRPGTWSARSRTAPPGTT